MKVNDSSNAGSNSSSSSNSSSTNSENADNNSKENVDPRLHLLSGAFMAKEFALCRLKWRLRNPPQTLPLIPTSTSIWNFWGSVRGGTHWTGMKKAQKRNTANIELRFGLAWWRAVAFGEVPDCMVFSHLLAPLVRSDTCHFYRQSQRSTDQEDQMSKEETEHEDEAADEKKMKNSGGETKVEQLRHKGVTRKDLRVQLEAIIVKAPSHTASLFSSFFSSFISYFSSTNLPCCFPFFSWHDSKTAGSSIGSSSSSSSGANGNGSSSSGGNVTVAAAREMLALLHAMPATQPEGLARVWRTACACLDNEFRLEVCVCVTCMPYVKFD